MSIILAISVSVAYNCVKPTCPFSSYTENRDYGYYSRSNGDCNFCRNKCNVDGNCGAVECGKRYCTWWKVGKCTTDQERTLNRNNPNTKLRTCTKGIYLKGFPPPPPLIILYDTYSLETEYIGSLKISSTLCVRY